MPAEGRNRRHQRQRMGEFCRIDCGFYWTFGSICEKRNYPVHISNRPSRGSSVTDANVLSNGKPSSISTSLLDRVRRKDQAAWQQLVRLFGPLVYRWCRDSGLNPEDARDVGQDVFKSVFASLGTFRRDRPGQSFRSWLRAVTRSRVCDAIRAMRLPPLGGSDHQTMLNTIPEPTPKTGDDDSEEKTLIYRRALDIVRARVTEKSWRAFQLVVLEERPVATAALELGMTVNSIYLVKSRIMRHLRGLLEEVGET